MSVELDQITELCRADGIRPRVHGNGFIQLDLTERKRLHVWGDPRIPRQKIPSTIHNHTFSFRSKILIGQLVHREINLIESRNGAYEIYQAVCNEGEDTRLDKRVGRVAAIIIKEQVLRKGDTYTFQAKEYHETVAPWLCVSVIDKDGPTLAQGGPNPNVLVPFGLEPDNTFNRNQLHPDILWKIIFEAFGKGKF